MCIRTKATIKFYSTRVNVNGGEYNSSYGGGRSLGIPKWQQKITTLIM